MSKESNERPVEAELSVRRRWHLAGLGVVLILAGVLRFGGITQVGIRFWDEGEYVRDAQLWHRCMLTLTDADALRAIFRGDKAEFQHRLETFGVDFTARDDKPVQGYTFLGALAMFVVGDRPAALLVLNALCGTLAVLVLYKVGVVLFNRSIGLCGAALLAVSPYHLVYCRSAMTEATAGFFVLVGVLVWASGRSREWSTRRTYGLSGIVFGYAIACHWRSAYVPFVLLAVDWLVAGHGEPAGGWIKARMGSVLKRGCWMVGGLALPLLAIQGMFLAVHGAAWVMDGWMPLTTYFEGYRHAFELQRTYDRSIAGGRLWNPAVSVGYARYFVHWHGMVAGILGLIGLVVVLRAKGVAKVAAVIVLAPIVVLLFQQYMVARALAPAVPFACLCAAAGLCWIVACFDRLIRSRAALGVVTAVMVLAVAVPVFANAQRLCRKRSHLADACAFIVEHGGGAVMVPENRCKYEFYLEPAGTTVIGGRAYRATAPEEVIAQLRRNGVRWMITDPQCWHFNDPQQKGWCRLFRWWLSVDEELARSAGLAAEFPHLSDYRWEFLVEGPGLGSLEEMKRKGGGPLRVYDLQAPPRSCSKVGRVRRPDRS